MKSPYKRTTYKGKPIDEHRKVMEQHLGRKLESWEIVHHINGDKTDDRIDNLQVISKEYNIKKDHVKKEMIVCVCPICGKEFLFDKKDLSTHPNPCCSRSCGGKKSIITARENFDGNLPSRSLIRGEIKDKIIELRKQGLSAYKIADKITNISRQTISRFLTVNKL